VTKKNIPHHLEGSRAPLCETRSFNGGFMHVIHMLYVSIQKHLERSLSEHGEISFSQFLILVGFSCNAHEKVTQAKLAEYLLLTEATVSRHVGILVAKKLLTKEQDIANKKMYNLKLTQEGSRIFEDSKKIITHELEKVFGDISEKDKKNIMQHFTKVISLLHMKK
jgi:DNA-binding MarR family transcriptional regulator